MNLIHGAILVFTLEGIFSLMAGRSPFPTPGILSLLFTYGALYCMWFADSIRLHGQMFFSMMAIHLPRVSLYPLTISSGKQIKPTGLCKSCLVKTGVDLLKEETA